MTTTANKIKTYKALRQMSTNQVTELKVFAERSVHDPNVITQFKILYNELDVIQSDFRKQHQSIIGLVATLEDGNLEVEEGIRRDFEYNSSYIRAIYHSLLEKDKESRSELPTGNIQVNKPNVKLPKIEIPKFSGDIKQFKPFFDMFNSLVYENTTLSHIEKFNYLISVLQGPPLALIQCTPMTGDNFEIAYQSLVRRYDNKRLIAFAHLQTLDNAPIIGSTKNSKLMRTLVDTFSENLSALKNMNFPVAEWDFLLFYIFSKHLDQDTLTRFELEHPDSTQVPSFESLKSFVVKQCNALDAVDYSNVSKNQNAPTKTEYNKNKSTSSTSYFKPKQTSLLLTNTSAKKIICSLCKNDHQIYRCPSFYNKTPQERFTVAKENNWCINCLSSQHITKNCNSLSTCRHCARKHHSLLHIFNNNRNISQTNYHGFRNSNSRASVSEPQISQNIANAQPQCSAANQQLVNINHDPIDISLPSTSQPNNNNNFCGVMSTRSNVLLSTALVEVLDSRGNYQKARALLDSGSQTSYMSQKLFNNLGLLRFKVNISIQGLSSMNEITTNGGASCTIKPVGKLNPTFDIDTIILPKLCSNMPSTYIERGHWSHINNLTLADPLFNQPSTIDLLLGADMFPHILKSGRIQGNINEPVAINTVFGYALMGRVTCDPNPYQNHNATSLYSCISNDICEINDTMKRFWQLEEIPKIKILSSEEESCESHFVKTHTRSKSGRYIVQLPFKTEPQFETETCRNLAIRRLFSLEKRLLANTDIYVKYSEYIQEYLESDYLELISETSRPTNCYYIPHHYVLKSDKFRIVYDATAKSDKNPSLNDALLVGPKLQKDIVSVLLKFRFHKVVFTCDIKGMFSQILVDKHNFNFQRIVWRFSPDEPVKDYRLKRVTFGLSCSPFLANRTIVQLARDEKINFPEAASILENDIYIDDIVTGCHSLQEAETLRDQLINILQLGGFELRKWSSNCEPLLNALPESHLYSQNNDFDFDSDAEIKILGLQWRPQHDNFSYKITPFSRECTKRNILSEIARVFDPLGFLTPLTIFAKYIMQYLWSIGLDWDEQAPAAVQDRWNQYKSELSILSEFSLPRRLIIDNSINCELHGFCDASQKAYGCVIYFRMQKKNDYHVTFVISKAKVSPLKQISIPRLELCSAVLLADLISFVTSTFSDKIKFSKIIAWTDSAISLSWIKAPPYKWKTFVSNRVARIQNKVGPDAWRHINSEFNPADCASRGLLPSELLQTKLWWAGPPWLGLPEKSWPLSSFRLTDNSELNSEVKTITLITQTSENVLDSLLQKFSSLSKIKRILCYIFRFIFNCKNSQNRNVGNITLTELNTALITLVKHVQHCTFSDDISNLKKQKYPSKTLRKLNTFVDDENVLRVGGRLSKSDLSYDRKFPAILPRNHRLTVLIIEDFHITYLHPGLQTLHFLIVQRFWILSAKRAIRQVISNCRNCWRLAPRPYQPPMGDLPKIRISQIKPFSCVMVDYAGPFSIKANRMRGAKVLKSYICVFVCSTTKSIHLELASDMSTDAFLCAFRRFIARRGRCSKLYSDCGTNFVGAHKEIVNMLKNAAEKENIDWHFNPPSAPHFSGLVEAGVKSVKTHLHRVIGDQILTFEELYTVIVQIESLLNSRPLCGMSSDPNDLSVLTPGHFLTLEPLSTLPDPDLSNLKLNTLNRWQLLQRLHQDFWSRWQREYLHTLQQRGKWLDSDSQVAAVGTLVLIKNENFPPSKWPLGRILSLHPGQDGVVRVATVLTKQGTFKRPLVKLCPLPRVQNIE